MKLRIIGRSSPYAGPGEAAIGYVVEDADCHVLLDCGSGVTAKYLERYSLADLKAVIISHLHPDHAADLFPLGFAVLHALMLGLRKEPVPLYLPPGGVDAFNTVLDCFGNLQRHYSQAFTYREYKADDQVAVGDWKVRFDRVYHGANCHGVIIEGSRGQRLGYTADTKMGPELERLFHGVDLLLCEATSDAGEHAQNTSHLTPEEAGQLAAAAGVGHLVLTHFLPGTDGEAKRRRAAQYFSGKVSAAEPDAVYAVGDR